MGPKSILKKSNYEQVEIDRTQSNAESQPSQEEQPQRPRNLPTARAPRLFSISATPILFVRKNKRESDAPMPDNNNKISRLVTEQTETIDSPSVSIPKKSETTPPSGEKKSETTPPKKKSPGSTNLEVADEPFDAEYTNPISTPPRKSDDKSDEPIFEPPEEAMSLIECDNKLTKEHVIPKGAMRFDYDETKELNDYTPAVFPTENLPFHQKRKVIKDNMKFLVEEDDKYYKQVMRIFEFRMTKLNIVEFLYLHRKKIAEEIKQLAESIGVEIV
ncbi:unnamed protein product [Brachionus calyciflorus]|uniref:Uncharacterized protein n=1 Tax=Brachionus calyciflorus TaxID=104777 RepID=A0A814KYR8_9BILA|nr:unnamed protein product [Brachionus calyciflorus]